MQFSFGICVCLRYKRPIAHRHISKQTIYITYSFHIQQRKTATNARKKVSIWSRYMSLVALAAYLDLDNCVCVVREKHED